MQMSLQRKQEIVKTLEKKGASLPCPRCGGNKFTLLEGYFSQVVQQEVNNNVTIGGPSVPSVVVACNQCGYMSQHALGVLGLMPTLEEKK